jgi:gamma-D-glutamyl-L-lysine dipeptidyl-peptidase
MYYQLKKRFSNSGIILMIMVIAFSCKPESNPLETANFLIDSIQSQTIADSRVEVFAIKASYLGDEILLKGQTTNAEAVTELENHLKLQRIVFTDSIVRLPDPALGGKIWGLVTLSVANLRYTAAHSAEMATQALMGTPVRILREDKGWYLVQTPDHYIAWTESAGIVRITEADLNQWKLDGRIIYLADYGSVINSATPDAMPVSDIVMGGILSTEKSSTSGGQYIAVRLPDGRKGFIKNKECQDFKTWCQAVQPDPANLLKVAYGFLGRPYLWGGTSVKAFDCSGFTKSLYLMGGLILARDASQQVLQGTEISDGAIWRELKSGDLLFFGRKATPEQTEKVTHVGMYAGDSEFIHCSGMVRVNSLDSTRTNFKPYYLTNLLHVKRIVGSPAVPISLKLHPWYN